MAEATQASRAAIEATEKANRLNAALTDRLSQIHRVRIGSKVSVRLPVTASLSKSFTGRVCLMEWKRDLSPLGFGLALWVRNVTNPDAPLTYVQPEFWDRHEG